MKHLRKVQIEKETTFQVRSNKLIPVLKRHQYFVESGRSITGDAPKEFIRVYEYGVAKKQSLRRWPLHIAKTGHKWYPNESITEHLLNRIGECLGLTMAQSQLIWAGGQIRFLSRYFLKEDEELIHGADVYAGYVNDKDWVEQIEAEDLARDFFTVQFTREALETVFSSQSAEIFEKFILMLLFDALVGNNDRHFYNWGIIRDLQGKTLPRFSPIYDTARGLFWNQSEEKIVALCKDKTKLQVFFNKYLQNSRPKIGWEGLSNINHFKLVEVLANHEYGIKKENILSLFSIEKLNRCFKMIDDEFIGLISSERINLIKHCLLLRRENLLKPITTLNL